MKPKQLQSFLQQLETFQKPCLNLEQYATSPVLATSILYKIDEEIGLEGCVVGDLGCGCGIFMLGSLKLNADFAIGFDIDLTALKICKQNILKTQNNNCTELVHIDLIQSTSNVFYEKFDVIITNPPFGTKNNAGIDLNFVKQGLNFLQPGGTLYSLHKTSTRNFIQQKIQKKWRDICEIECIAELQWNLDKTYRHQKQKTLDIAVDLFKFKKFDK